MALCLCSTARLKIGERMSDHTVITLICVLWGAWGILLSVAMGDLEHKLEKLERQLGEIERRLRGRPAA